MALAFVAGVLAAGFFSIVVYFYPGRGDQAELETAMAFNSPGASAKSAAERPTSHSPVASVADKQTAVWPDPIAVDIERESRSAYQTGVSSGGASPRKVQIKISDRSWEATPDGLRPRVLGEISLADEGDDAAYQLEIWVNAMVDGRKIGYDAIRVPIHHGHGALDEYLFLQDTDANFRSQPPFEIEIQDITLVEIPDFELEIETNEAPSGQRSRRESKPLNLTQSE